MQLKILETEEPSIDCQLKIWSSTQSVTNSWTRKRWKQEYIVTQNPYLWESVNNKTLNLPLLLIKICCVQEYVRITKMLWWNYIIQCRIYVQ